MQDKKKRNQEWEEFLLLPSHTISPVDLGNFTAVTNQ